MNVLFICPFNLGKTDIKTVATYKRLINLAKLFQVSGANVTIACVTTKAEEDYYADSIHYRFISLKALEVYRRRLASIFYTDLIVKYLMQKGETFLAVCIYGGYFTAGFPLLRARKKNHFKLGYVINDWYQLKSPSLLGKINILLGRNLVYPRFSFAIVVSRWLEKRCSRACRTLLIPALMEDQVFDDVNGLHEKRSSKTSIAYAGNIADKDIMRNAIWALQYLSPEQRERIELHFYGSLPEGLFRKIEGGDTDIPKTYKSTVFFHGFMPQQQLRAELSSMDYTMFFRPDKPYSRAGFANKFAESLSMSIPVITNITGDMGAYLHDSEEGIVAKSEHPKDIAAAFKRALSIGTLEHANMRKKAYETARESFQIASYIETTRAFLKALEV